MARRRDIDQLQGEIEELFSDLWQVPRFSGTRRGYRPAVDAYRCEDPPRVVVIVELAGVDPADVHVDASSRKLVVRGERRRPRVPGRYHVMELDYGPFERTIHLGEDVDVEHAAATLRNGLLEIVLPLAERAQGAVEIPIEVSSRP